MQIELFKEAENDFSVNDYDLIIVNSSGGKDSVCAIYETIKIATSENFPKERIIVSHQDLQDSEWEGTTWLAKKQADVFGLRFEKNRRTDKHSKEETLLEYALRRGKWPSRNQRWCTSDFKRAPGAKIARRLSKEFKAKKVLYVFGFRAEESPARKKKKQLMPCKHLTTKSRLVKEWNPILDWTTKKVWQIIKENKLPYHFAYDLGMPRLSCVFCIFSPFDALVIAGKANFELLEKYVEVEEKINHGFREDLWLKDVKKAIENGYEPKTVQNWVM